MWSLDLCILRTGNHQPLLDGAQAEFNAQTRRLLLPGQCRAWCLLKLAKQQYLAFRERPEQLTPLPAFSPLNCIKDSATASGKVPCCSLDKCLPPHHVVCLLPLTLRTQSARRWAQVIHAAWRSTQGRIKKTRPTGNGTLAVDARATFATSIINIVNTLEEASRARS